MAGEDTRFGSGLEPVKNGRKGGVNSGKSRREKAPIKAAMRECALLVLGMKRKVSDKTAEQLKEMGISQEEITTQMLAVMKLGDMAINGNVKAFEVLRDTSGQKPTDKTELIGSLNGDINITIGGTEDDD